MNLELLLSIICLASTPEACASLGQAYYKQSGYEDEISDYSNKIQRKHQKLVSVIVLASSINEKQIIIPVADNSIIGYKYSQDINNIFFKRSF